MGTEYADSVQKMPFPARISDSGLPAEDSQCFMLIEAGSTGSSRKAVPL